MKRLEDFSAGDAFLLEELEEMGYTREDIDGLVSEGKLKEKIDGVYYIGGVFYLYGLSFEASLSPRDALILKYVGRNCERGYLDSFSMLNGLGLCDQVPNYLDLRSTLVTDIYEGELDGARFTIKPAGDYTLDKLEKVYTDLMNKYEGFLDVSKRVAIERIRKVCDKCVSS